MKNLFRASRLILLATIAVPAVVVLQGCSKSDDIAPSPKDAYSQPAQKKNPYKGDPSKGAGGPMGAPTPPPD